MLKEKKSNEYLINSFNKSEKETDDLYDIYLLAKEENNTQILGETLNNFKRLKEDN